MPKKRLTQIAKETGVDYDDLLKIVKTSLEKNMYSGVKKIGDSGMIWISEDGQNIINSAISVKKEKPSEDLGEKKSISQLAEEYNVSEAHIKNLINSQMDSSIYFCKMENETWLINKLGQVFLDDVIAMPVVYRGQVLNQCINDNFVYVRHKERAKKVPVKIPTRMKGKITPGKIIYFIEYQERGSMKYKWTRP